MYFENLKSLIVIHKIRILNLKNWMVVINGIDSNMIN